MKLVCLVLAAGAALAQTTRYPGAVDSDSSLFVVNDNIQTTLNAAMSTSDTAMVVASATGFVPNMIVTICDTQTNTGKCTAWEHMLVTAVSGNVLTVTRAFAGTSARSHSSGRLVSVLIDSAHQKVLKDSVVAIETALGPNLINIGGGSPVVNAGTFAFSPYSCNSSSVCTPGGPSGMSLIAGNNTLTMTPIPNGVNGSDSGHRLYVSGGTGAADSCLITGGSGTSGQPSGQLIINCANTHSGAWTIRSATTGVSEAMQAACTNNSKSVLIPGGSYTFYAAATIPCVNLHVIGAGAGTTTIVAATAGMTVFNANGTTTEPTASLYLDIGNFTIDGHANFPGVNTLSGVKIVFASENRIHDIQCTDVYRCIQLDQGYDDWVWNIGLQNNSTIWAGSTSDSNGWPYEHLYNLSLNHIRWTITNGTFNLAANDALIYLQRVVGMDLNDFGGKNTLSGKCNGVYIGNDSQGNYMRHLDLVGAINGVLVSYDTVGTTAQKPDWLTISDSILDLPTLAAVQIRSTAALPSHFIKIINIQTSGTPTMTAGVYFNGTEANGSCFGCQVLGGNFQNITAKDQAGVLAVNTDGFTVQNAYFSIGGTAYAIRTSGTGDQYQITGNFFTCPGTGACILEATGAAHRTLMANHFWPNIGARTSPYEGDSRIQVGCNTAPPASSTGYFTFTGSQACFSSTIGINQSVLAPTAGTAHNLSVVFGGIVPSVTTITLMVQNNPTTLTCTIPAGQQGCTDTTHAVDINSQSLIGIQVVTGAGVYAGNGAIASFLY
jgi:hypothetical protein